MKKTKTKTRVSAKSKIDKLPNVQVQGLFATPKDAAAIAKWIDSLNGSERLVAMTASGMTWNYFATLINEAKK